MAIKTFKASLEAERALGLLVQISIPSATLVVQEVWMGNSSLHVIFMVQSQIPSDFNNTNSALSYSINFMKNYAYQEASDEGDDKQREC